MEMVYSITGALLLLVAGFLVGSMYRAGIVYKKTMPLENRKTELQMQINSLELEVKDLEHKIRIKDAKYHEPYIPFYPADVIDTPFLVYHGDFMKLRTTPVRFPFCYSLPEHADQELKHRKTECSKLFVDILCEQNLINFVFIQNSHTTHVELHAELLAYPFKPIDHEKVLIESGITPVKH